MLFPIAKPLRSVGRVGAEANAVLRGVGENNRDLLIQASQAQERGHDGPIQGSFVILEIGEHRHSETLTPLLNKATTAQEVLSLLRKKHPNCVNVVNASSLIVDSGPPQAQASAPAEPPAAPPASSRP